MATHVCIILRIAVTIHWTLQIVLDAAKRNTIWVISSAQSSKAGCGSETGQGFTLRSSLIREAGHVVHLRCVHNCERNRLHRRSESDETVRFKALFFMKAAVTVEIGVASNHKVLLGQLC